MAREFVTRSSRFYCVSLKPDLCKTPMGNSTPPIPYTIIGEFADATGVSPNIKSGGDPVAINASTVIPCVAGDAPGSANGLKSGTVGKRVQHDGKSKATSFNGECTIREGDTVWMNDKNTNGKIHERDGQAARPRIQPAGAPPPEKSFGDKFDDAMFAGADKINAGKEWIGGKINDFAQTGVGGKVMDGLKWVSEKTELTAVKQWKEGLAANVDNAVQGGGRGMMAAGALTTAALEAIPTSVLDLLPGGGKAAGTAGKVASTASKLEHAAGDAAKLGHKAEEAAGAAGKTGHAAGDAAKGGEKAAADAEGAGKGAKEGEDGGKSKRPKRMDEHKPKCFKPGDDLKKNYKGDPKKLEKEFYRQLKDQEAGLNNMTVKQYLNNRTSYEQIQRMGTGQAQAVARTNLANKIAASAEGNAINRGVSPREAAKVAAEQTKQIMAGLASLHNPDLKAGGADVIGRVGDKNVNSSLGSQWAKSDRIPDMDAAAHKAMQEHGPDAKMNVKLERCKN